MYPLTLSAKTSCALTAVVADLLGTADVLQVQDINVIGAPVMIQIAEQGVSSGNARTRTILQSLADLHGGPKYSDKMRCGNVFGGR